MSYDAEWMDKPLTGDATDLLILQEREQRCSIGVNGHTDRMIIPTTHFCELRDMYIKLLRERDGMPEEPGKMSVEQAAAILNPETSREALAAYEYYGGFRGKEAAAAACKAARWIAVKIMREKLSAERRQGKEVSHE